MIGAWYHAAFGMKPVHPFEIDADVRRAETLPASFYRDPAMYAAQLEHVFARSYHWVDDDAASLEPGMARPLTLMEGSLNEPIMFTRTPDGARSCLANVCTHRANLVVNEACKTASLRCRYHGRRFGLDGRFLSMPEFDHAVGFPTARDDLAQVPHGDWGPLTFAGVAPAMSFDDWLGPFRARLSFVPWASLERAGDLRHYDVDAHWAVYCDNYLEGFHVPFVHASLNEVIDYGSYATELAPWGTLQIGFAKHAEDAFELPADHPDRGKLVAAYYAFLYPATMVNVYPWGVSLNAIRPIGIDKTRVTYGTWVHDPAKRARGAGADLHRVELEDDAIVANVQRGVRSRFYQRGRYSPTRETGVHHFHRLLAAALAPGGRRDVAERSP
jgi:choline monooxygenase